MAALSSSIPHHSRTWVSSVRPENAFTQLNHKPALYASCSPSAITRLRVEYVAPCKTLLVHSCAGNGGSLASENDASTQLRDEQEKLLKARGKEVVQGLKGTSIFLIGMMGSGKTTVGKYLAKALSYNFCDSDKVVEQYAGGVSVAEIFKDGEEGFREVESRVLAELSSMTRMVIATGGGAVIKSTNWGYLRHGVTVWIDVPLEALAKRVVESGTGTRPLLASTSKESEYRGALDCLKQIFNERGDLYANADAVVSLQKIALEMGVDVSSLTPPVIALKILDEIDMRLLYHKKKMKSFYGA